MAPASRLILAALVLSAALVGCSGGGDSAQPVGETSNAPASGGNEKGKMGEQGRQGQVPSVGIDG